MTAITELNKKSLWQTFGIFFVIFFAIIIPVCVYIERSILSIVVTYQIALQFYFMILPTLVIAIIISIGVAAIYTLGWRLNLLKPRHTNVPRLLLAVFCASLLARFAPVVPTSEQLYFAQHKSEFEHQVELVKQRHPNKYFSNLTIYVDPPHSIVFGYTKNYRTEYAYVYAEQYSDLEDVSTCTARWNDGYGQIYATLSPNWYLCYRPRD